MTARTGVPALLSALDCVCEDTGPGSWRFSGALGRGHVSEESDGRVWLRYAVSAVVSDPLELARIASRVGPARIVLRHRSPVAELTCAVEELPAALSTLVSICADNRLAGDREQRQPPVECESESAGCLSVVCCPSRVETGPVPPVIDVEVGVLAPIGLHLEAPAFVRLALPETPLIDTARATYLLVANARLRCATGGWCDGPGLTVPARSESPRLAEELFEIAQGLRVLAEARVAQSYLDLCGLPDTTQPRDPTGVATTAEGGAL